jgi:hypothetical protein
MFAAGKTAGVSAGDGVDPQFNYVTMLLHGDGTNGAQNNTFLDSSTNNFTITRNGNTTQGSFSPYGSNWSNNFGSANFFYSASNSAFEFGGSDFTVEAWVFPTSYGTLSYVLGVAVTNGLVFYVNSGNLVVRSYNGSDLLSSSTIPALNTWTHVAASRSGTTLRIFVNGVQTATTTNSTSFAQGAIYAGNDSTNAAPWFGYISNLRVVKGSAVYTSNFTPSTAPLTAISGTSWLVSQSNRFVDNSANNFAIITSGTPSVQRFNPFGTATAYSTSVIGGSGYFDGDGDYLTAPSNSAFAMGTGDFTIECWVNTPLVSGQNDVIIELRSSGGTSTGFVFNMNPTGSGYQLNFYTDGGFNLGSTNLNYNVWNHCAVTRSGTTVRLFSNGVVSATFTKANNFSDTPTPYIGASPLYTSNDIVGYLSDLRVVKGTALYTSAFTPPTAPLTAVSGTSMLLNYTNGAIIDNAMMNDLETVGNAQISTSVKKYGTGSMAFDGTGDALYSTSQATTFGTGDFTLEFWIYFNAVNNSTVKFIYDMRNSGATSASFLAQEASGNNWTYWNGAGTSISSGFTSSTFTASTWTHIAICRSSGTTKFFVNGTQTNSVADTSNYANSTLTFGARYSISDALNGYIDDLRITKGYARYTANFTPPTAALPDIGPV